MAVIQLAFAPLGVGTEIPIGGVPVDIRYFASDMAAT
jgi:hypothetical protein